MDPSKDKKLMVVIFAGAVISILTLATALYKWTEASWNAKKEEQYREAEERRKKHEKREDEFLRRLKEAGLSGGSTEPLPPPHHVLPPPPSVLRRASGELNSGNKTFGSEKDAFTEAVKNGDKNEVSAILKNHPDWAKLNEEDNNFSPLYTAVLSGKADILLLLLEKGANPNIPMTKSVNMGGDHYIPAGWTPLHWACLLYPDCIPPLLDAGTDVNARTSDVFKASGVGYAITMPKGITPLHCAMILITDKSPKIIESLIMGGANPNICDNGMNSPLHLLVLAQPTPESNNAGEIFKLLVRHKANPDAENADGKTPLLLAKDNQRDAWVDFLIYIF